MVNFSARTEPFDFAGTPFDAAIHFGAPHWAGAVCEYLMHEETVPVCSPTYRDRHNIRTPQDLTRVALLQQSTRPTQWAEWFELAGAPTALALRGPQSEHFAMIAQAAVSHLGAALLPRFLIEQELAAGSLVELSDLVLTSTDAYYLVYPEARAQSPLVKAFPGLGWWPSATAPETRPQGCSARGANALFTPQRRHRAQRKLGKQVALHEPDATVGHKVALRQRFNALGNHGDTPSLTQPRQVAHYRLARAAGVHGAPGHVDLDDVRPKSDSSFSPAYPAPKSSIAVLNPLRLYSRKIFAQTRGRPQCALRLRSLQK